MPSGASLLSRVCRDGSGSGWAIKCSFALNRMGLIVKSVTVDNRKVLDHVVEILLLIVRLLSCIASWLTS